MLGDAEGVELLDAPKMEAIGAAEPTQNWMENHGFWGFQRKIISWYQLNNLDMSNKCI